ncbi:PTS sugar transporter subunit IIA [Dongshaea marina]|uniref:PTS sugar transporter subunit IIA n=1 Tax=Dongshaea marina TaxID=2047966 RepID=UPI000D3E069C|nr:PTS sugar transporter subunit IIA [Dongshaea marina]
MLHPLLPKSLIRIESSAKNWQQAVELATEKMTQQGYIEPGYTQAIIKSHQELGPYYVLAPGIAMPHARPEDGVNKLGLALTVIQQGVHFDAEENDPVHLLVTLAATDSDSHVEAISQLAELFMNQQDVDAICASQSIEQIEEIIARY